MLKKSPRQTESQQILDSFRRIVQVLQNYSKTLETKLGLSGAQLFVLQKVSEAQPCSINDLAEKTLTHQSSVSVVVERLVQKSLVERKADPTDKRRVLILVSAKGRRLLAKAEATPQEKLIKGILKLSDQRRQQLAETLAAVLGDAGFAIEVPDLFFEVPKRAKKLKRKGYL